MLDFNSEPDFINDIGVKYWYNEKGSSYARKYGFTSYISWYIELPNSKQSVVLINNCTNKIIKEFSKSEDLHAYIDFLTLHKLCKEK